MSHVLVLGAGAIGSHLLPHLARSPQVSRVTIVDRDGYDATNIRGQQIERRHVGKSKAAVQAALLRRINPNLPVRAIHAGVEDLPLGTLRASAILACLDSRRARMVVNQAAWRLNVPWIDAGVSAEDLIVRVRVLVPGPGAPCMECSWEQADYDAVEQVYPCARDAAPHATNAASSLGALAAALQAIECDKLLAGDTTLLAGRDVRLGARHHTHHVTTYPRNAACRMPDHDAWRIDPLGDSPNACTLADAAAIGSTLNGASVALLLGVAGQRVATTLCCSACGHRVSTLLLERQTRAWASHCAECGGPTSPVGFDLQEFVPVATLSDQLRQRPLSAIGARPGDVITLRTPNVEAHLEVGGRT